MFESLGKATIFDEIDKILEDQKYLVIDTAITGPVSTEDIKEYISDKGYEAVVLDIKDLLAQTNLSTDEEEHVTGSIREHSAESYKAFYRLVGFTICGEEEEDFGHAVRKRSAGKEKGPVLLVVNVDTGIGDSKLYELISFVQDLFQARYSEPGATSIILIGNEIREDLCSDHEYGNVRRKGWVSSII